MQEKLTAKTQEIKSNLPPSAKEFSDGIEYIPEESGILNKKGSLYGVYTIWDSTTYETDLVTKLVRDILSQSYYKSENASPIQALECAISDVKDKVLKLKENGEEETSPTGFTMIAAALWGNVIYVVRIGNGKVHIVREGDFKEVEILNEGNFGVATGVVKPGEVLVITTEDFFKRLPPRKLLKLNPKELDSLNPTESCLMVKFDKEEANSDQKIENFGIKPKKQNPIKKGRQKIQKAISRKKGKKETITPGITDIRIKKPKISKKKKLYAGISLISIALIGALLWTLKTDTPNRLLKSTKTEKESSTIPKDSNTENDNNKNKEMEEIPGMEVFYDLKLTDTSIEPKYLEIVGDKILTAGASGNLYISNLETPKFEKIPGAAYENINGLESLEGEVYINSPAGLSIYNPLEETTNNYEIPGSEVFFPYLSSIYQIEEDQIKKYTIDPNRQEEDIETAVWAQREEVQGTKDMAISISIYLLTAEGKIAKYTSGTRENFELTNLENPLVNPVILKTKWDWDNMYILDKGTNRIVVITKEGEFIDEFTSSNWNDLRDVGIDLEEENLFILEGSKIFQLEL